MARPKKSDQQAERKNAEYVSPELQEANAEERRTRLKTLIVLGKERGYLTYAEINDHLPDDVQNSEQIDGIIGMINDMGIQVYEEAPDAEVLLMSDAPAAVTDEDAVEEAEQALATVDSEFGRTTDPVRMYMREMGTVDLLTRESEIEIARRIEDGLKHMVQAIAACPTTIAALLVMVDKVENDELSVDDLVDGLIDSDIGLDDAMTVEAAEEDETEVEEDEDDDEDGAKAAAISAEALAKLNDKEVIPYVIETHLRRSGAGDRERGANFLRELSGENLSFNPNGTRKERLESIRNMEINWSTKKRLN